MPPGPVTVVIEIGGNDLLSGLPSGEFRKALAPLLATAGGPARSVVMFELPLLPLQNAYGEVQRDLSRRYGVTLLPRRLLAGVVAHEARTVDGLHLSPAGHEWLADRVWEIFRP
jgi:acyl-CoA thioesterase I